eukprot:GEZU01022135.1.p1 GENE.GEZU01022135.1~~GEZU01022135.1.p1  ORF type:complete len:436 (-),score=125.25 GEZU01022135.1:60-1367(-)
MHLSLFPRRYRESVYTLLLGSNKSPINHYDMTSQTKQFLQNDCRVLIIGAGGLGCEILKNLALSGFRNIDIIDMDCIDLSNLNRQFLFREADVGKFKAEVAAKFVMERVPGVTVTAHNCRIQDYDEDFYSQFHLVISGLDAIEPRRWINSMLCNLVQYQEDSDEIDTSTVIPLIDGGTEGFKGQARVILPKITACFECTLDLFPPQVNYPICTIAFTPRLPEHCIEYASAVEWKKTFGDDKKIDGDNPEHIEWLFKTASERAEKFKIPGVTYRLTQGVVKNIIPAIASTNAIISAACTNEAFKYVTKVTQSLDDYMMYNGAEGIYTYTYQNERKPDCNACGHGKPKPFEIQPTETLQDLLDRLKSSKEFQLQKPSIRTEDNRSLYMSHPAALERATRPNLSKTMGELVQDGLILSVTDPSLGKSVMQLKILFPVV